MNKYSQKLKRVIIRKLILLIKLELIRLITISQYFFKVLGVNPNITKRNLQKRILLGFIAFLIVINLQGQTCTSNETIVIPAAGIIDSNNQSTNTGASGSTTDCTCSNGDDPGIHCNLVTIDLSNRPAGACVTVDAQSNTADLMIIDAATCNFLVDGAAKTSFEVTDLTIVGNIAQIYICRSNNGNTSVDFEYGTSGSACLTCTAEAGTINQAAVEECVGDMNLNLGLTTANVTGEEIKTGYGYAFLIVNSSADTIISNNSTDFSSFNAGTYEVCGLSYLESDITTIGNLDAAGAGIGDSYSALAVDLASATPSFCGDLTNTCVSVIINALPTAEAGTDATICAGDSTQLTATGGTSYVWSPTTGLSASNIANPKASPTDTTKYYVTVTDANSCTAIDSVVVNVMNCCAAEAGIIAVTPDPICPGGTITSTVTGLNTNTTDYSTIYAIDSDGDGDIDDISVSDGNFTVPTGTNACGDIATVYVFNYLTTGSGFTAPVIGDSPATTITNCTNATCCDSSSDDFSINDVTAPVITAGCTSPISSLDCGDGLPDTLLISAFSITETCSGTASLDSVRHNQSLGDLDFCSAIANARTIERTYYFSDDCGNVVSCVQDLEYDQDVTAPVITAGCTSPISSLDCGDGLPDTLTIGDFSITETCSGTASLDSVRHNQSLGDLDFCSATANARTIERTYYFSDDCGNVVSCVQDLEYDQDVTAPVITAGCTSPISSLDCGDGLPDTLLISAFSITESCSGTASLDSVRHNQSLGDLDFCSATANARTIERTYYFSDDCGNVVSCVQDLEYDQDVTAPVITAGCTSPISSLDCADGLPDTLLISAFSITESCSGTASLDSVRHNQSLGDLDFCSAIANARTIERTYYFSDDCGNVVSCVQDLEYDQDVTAPVITAGCTSPISSLDCGDGLPDTLLISAFSITESCSGTASLDSVRHNQSLGDLDFCSATASARTIERTYYFSDDCGNVVSCVQDLEYDQDVTAPVITAGCTSPISSLDCGDGLPDTLLISAFSITETCSGTASLDSVRHNQSLGDLDFCSAIANARTIERTYYFSDDCGNVVSCVQDLEYDQDVTAPVITAGCTSPISSLDCGDGLPDTLTIGDFSITETCSGTASLDSVRHNQSLGDLDFCSATANARTIERTYYFSDDCGNVVSCVQDLEYDQDVTAPVITAGCTSPISSLDCADGLPDTLLISAFSITESCSGTASLDSVRHNQSLGDLDFCSAIANARTIERTYYFSDDCGNVVSCVQDLEYDQDVTAPVITAGCTSPISSLDCGDGLPDTLLISAFSITESCSGTASLDSVRHNQSLGDLDFCSATASARTIERTYYFSDDCGNVVSCVQDLEYDQDVTAPVITAGCTSPISSLDCGDGLPDTLLISAFSITETCSGTASLDSVRHNQSLGDLDFCSAIANARTIERTYYFSDDCGNVVSCVQDLEYDQDVTAPVITAGCTSPISSLDCGDGLPDTLLISAFSITETCSGTASLDSVRHNQSLGDLDFCSATANARTIERTYYFSDDCGNVVSCVQDLEYDQDVTAPVITAGCTSPISSLDCADGLPDTLLISAFSITESCSGTASLDSVRHNQSLGDLDFCSATASARTIERTYYFSDDCGNVVSCVQDLEYDQDVTAPVITAGCTSTISSLDCGDGLPDTLLISAFSITETCSGTASLDSVRHNQSLGDLDFCSATAGDRTIVRTYYFSDDCGNVVSCSENLIFDQDVTAPVITAGCTSPISSLDCGDGLPDTLTIGDFSITETCSGTASLDSVRHNQSLGDLDFCSATASARTIERTYYFSDDCGNVVSCVQDLEYDQDVTAPVITAGCTSPISSLDCGDGLPDTLTIGDFSITETCSGTASLDSVRHNQSLGDLDFCSATASARTIERTYYFSDDCGNVVSCVQDLEYDQDVTAPVITAGCTSPISSLDCGDGLPDTLAIGAFTFTEACGGGTVTLDSVRHDETIAGLDFCSAIASNRTIVRTYYFSDDCGNVVSCSQNLIFTEDTTAPVIDTGCPSDETTGLDCETTQLPDTLAIGAFTFTEACGGGSVTLDSVRHDQTIANLDFCSSTASDRTIVRTYYFSDDCGNVVSCSQNLIFTEDTTAPVITSCPSDVTSGLNYTSNLPDTLTIGDFSFTEACSSVTLDSVKHDKALSSIDFCSSTSLDRTIERTYYFSDDCGNVVSCTQNLIFEQDEPSLVINSISCASDLLTYSVNITATGGDVSTNSGTLNPSGTTVSGVPSGTSVIITVKNSTTDCMVNETITRDCNCPAINQPSDPNDPTICEGATTPALTVSVDVNQVIDWYATSSSTDILATATSYIPSVSNPGEYNYWTEARDTFNNCTSSLRREVSLTIEPLPILNDIGDIEICDGEATSDIIFIGDGTSYSWTNDNTDIGLTASGSGDITSFQAVNTGINIITANIIVTPFANGCQGNAKQFTINVDPCHLPSINVLKTYTISDNTPIGTGIGDVVNYTIAVKNTGNVILTDVGLTDVLTDANGTLLSLDNGPTFVSADDNSLEGILNPGETATYTASYTITQSDVDAGGIFNTAISTGKDPSDNDVTDISDDGITGTDDTGNDTTKIDITANPNLEVIKTSTITDNASSGTGAGDIINYTITVENTGNVTLTSIGLTDILTNGDGTVLTLDNGPTFISSNDNSPKGTLKPGETATYNATYTIQLADENSGNISNIVTATGKDPKDNTISDISDDGITNNGNDNPTIVTVHPVPKITASAINSVLCEGENIILSATFSANGSSIRAEEWKWTGPGGFTSTAQNPIIVGATLAESGTYTVEVTDNNGRTQTASVVITIHPLPSFEVQSIDCSINLATYEIDILTSGDIVTASIGTVQNNGNNSFTIKNIPSGSTTEIKVLSANLVCEIIRQISQNCTCPNLNPPTNGGDKTICLGAPIPILTVSVATNQTANWFETESGTIPLSNGINTTSFLPPVNATGTYIYYVETIDAINNCKSFSRTPVALTIQNAIIIDPIDNLIFCHNSPSGAIDFSGTANTFIWSNSNPQIGLGTGGTGNIPSFIAQNITNTVQTALINISATANGCTSEMMQFTISVNPLPTAQQATLFVCANGNGSGNFNLDNAATQIVGNTVGTNIQYFASLNDAQNNNNALSSNYTTTQISQTIYARVEGSSGCVNTSTIELKINELLEINIDSTICQNDNSTYTIYVRTNGGVLTATNGTIMDNGNNTYSVKVNTGINTLLQLTNTVTGCVSEQNISAPSCSNNCSENPNIASQNIISPSICGANDGSLIIDNLQANTTYTIQYTNPNSISQVINATANVSGQVTLENLQSGTYQNFVFSNQFSGCQFGLGTTNSITISDGQIYTPTLPTIIQICEDETVTLAMLNSENIPTTANFIWTGSNGFHSTEISPQFKASRSDTGIYSIVVEMEGCLSTNVSTRVIINPSPKVTIDFSGGNCGESLEFTAEVDLALGSNINDFYWVGPNNFTSNEKTPSIVNPTASNIGTYSLIVTDNFGCTSTTASVLVDQINQITTEPSINSNAVVFCENSSIMLTATEFVGDSVSYIWTIDNGTKDQVISTQPSLLVENPDKDRFSGIYTLQVYVDGCLSMTSNSIPIQINPSPLAPVVSETAFTCSGTTLNLEANGANNLTYHWTGPLNFTSNEQNPIIENALPVNSGIYQVFTSNNNCQSESASIIVEVDAVPSPVQLSSLPPLCEGDEISLKVENPLDGVEYDWYNINGEFVGEGIQLFLGQATLELSNSYYVVARYGNIGCFYDPSVDENAPASAFSTVSISSKSNMEVFAGEDAIICDSNFELLATELSPDSDIFGEWVVLNNAEVTIMDVKENASPVSNLPSGTTSLVWTIYNEGCGQLAADTINLTYLPPPTLGDDLVQTNFNESKSFSIILNDTFLTDFYTIEIIEAPQNGSAVLGENGIIGYIPNATFDGTDEFSYRVCADFCEERCDTAKVTVDVTVDQSEELMIPNVFTPNNDGMNDNFVIPGIGKYAGSSLIIFNRWGDEIYRNEDYRNDWAGTYEGADLPVGTYFYILKVNDSIKRHFQGYVYIQRE